MSGSVPVVWTFRFCRVTWLNGLMEAESTVIWAFIALLTFGRMKPLKKAELVATKYRTTIRTTTIPASETSIRSQERLLLRPVEPGVVSVINNSALKCY